MVCNQCGKTIEVEGVAFCPFCGAKLAAGNGGAAEVRNGEAEKWIRKALAVKSYPERKKILEKALEACPDSREIRWEKLFVGEPETKRTRMLDFSVIKSWCLEIYLKPKDFSDEKKDRMRAQLFDAPELVSTLNLFEEPGEKQREYLNRLCREYVELFLEGNNQVMGNFLGFHIDHNREKKLAVPVAQMIDRIRADEKLLPEQREQLWKSLYQAYAARTDGKTEYLDEKISSRES